MTITSCNNFVVESLNITHLKIARIHMASILAILIKLVYLTPSLESVMTTFLLVNVNISGITCGPGHDINIDRLGKKPKENSVSGSFVSNSSLTNITNGVRIKTFHNSPKIQASNITFEDITIKDVQNPIIIDQHYRSKNTTNVSLAKISDVHYRNIRDSSVSNVAVTLNCSSSVPCEGMELIDIDIILNSNSLKKLLPLSSSYSFAKPVFKGKQNSPTCE
ncbi:unnamed protein product [Camellia sinensis]